MSRPRWFRGITKDSFFLTHGCSLDFLLAQWCDNPLVYAAWATLCSVYTVVLIIYTSAVSEQGIKIVIWLTYWAFYSVTLRFIITAWNCWQFVLRNRTNCNANIFFHLPNKADNCNNLGSTSTRDTTVTSTSSEEQQISASKDAIAERSVTVCSVESSDKLECDKPDGLSAMVRCQWFLQSITNSVTVLVTVLFWTLVYKGEPQPYISINSHVISSLLVLADIMISRAPIRIQHFHIPLIYLAIYIAFTLIYWAAGGTNHNGDYYIYSVLDYSKRVKTAVLAICLIALFGMLLTQMFLYFLYRLRNCLYSWRKSGKFLFHEQ